LWLKIIRDIQEKKKKEKKKRKIKVLLYIFIPSHYSLSQPHLYPLVWGKGTMIKFTGSLLHFKQTHTLTRMGKEKE
jgi:hypothetical protein